MERRQRAPHAPEVNIRALLRPIANASFGAEVIGLNLRQRPNPAVLEALQQQMAERGFLVFRGQGVLTPEEQIEAIVNPPAPETEEAADAIVEETS